MVSTIFKYSQNDYSDKVELICPKYNSTEASNGENGPNIKVDINTNYNNPSFTYEVEARNTASAKSPSFKIDSTAPVLSFKLSGSTSTVICADPDSGVVATTLQRPFLRVYIHMK